MRASSRPHLQSDHLHPSHVHTYAIAHMGKSNKKVKSDRINALRKQYDAFLEEDKRRKERNEFILGRLDKMRYCTAVVPLRHKPTLFADRKENLSTSSSLSQLNKSPVDIPRHCDETTVLYEISKKYILIPKIRSNMNNETDNISIPSVRPTFEENGDWKSKYEILEQLKRREKEPDASGFSSELSQQNNYDNLPEPDIQKYYDHKIDQPTPAYKYELPEKDNEGTCKDNEDKCAEVQNQFETKIDSSFSALSNNHIDDIQIEEPQINQSTVNALPQNDLEFNNNSQQMETYQSIKNQTEPSPTFIPEPAPIDENNEHNTQNYPMGNYDENVNPDMVSKQYKPVEEDKDIGDPEKVYSEDIQSVEVIHPDDLVKQINDTVTISENIERNQDYEYPIETINVQEFTPDSQVILQDGVNINPEEYPAELSNAYALENSTPTYDYNRSSEIIDHVENTLDTSGIEAFDAEQREMFYSEGATENYGYNEDGVLGGYEQEVPMPGAEYSQADTAVYYEGYDAQQLQPVEISEHEEANQRYDQNYEQQYATNISEQELSPEGYNEQMYTQNPNREGDLNQVQDGLGQFQFEQQHEYETVESIEQQLDTEQGYNEQIIMSNIEKPIEDLQAMSPKPSSK